MRQFVKSSMMSLRQKELLKMDECVKDRTVTAEQEDIPALTGGPGSMDTEEKSIAGCDDWVSGKE